MVMNRVIAVVVILACSTAPGFGMCIATQWPAISGKVVECRSVTAAEIRRSANESFDGYLRYREMVGSQSTLSRDEYVTEVLESRDTGLFLLIEVFDETIMS